MLNNPTQSQAMVIYFYLHQFKLILYILSLLVLFKLAADSTFQTTGKQAEKLFFENLYSDALPFYSQLLTFPLEENLKTQLTLRLATCYLEEGQPQTALTLISPLESRFHYSHCLYLMSWAHRHLGQSSHALNLLQQCSSKTHSPYLDHLIALEQGYHFMHLGDFTSAQLAFEKIQWQQENSLPYALAQLHLAKIQLMTHQLDTALHTLFLLSSSLPLQHPLTHESLYLKGWLWLAKHENSQAMSCFEELLPRALALKTPGLIQVLNGLIISYLKQILSTAADSDDLQILLCKTDDALQKLLKRAPTETSYLLLGDFYLIKAKCLNDPSSYTQAQQLLKKHELFSSAEGHQQALLKYAEAAPSYQERDQLYKQLSTNPHHSQSFCAIVWFLKGLNHFEEGLRYQKQQDLQASTEPLEQAAQAFNQVFHLSKQDSTRSALALKYQALAYVHQPYAEKAQQAWQILTQLITDSSLLITFDDPQEITCLAAWTALHVPQSDILKQAQVFLQQAQQSFKLSSIWKERCLKLEGLICLQLEEWQQADDLFARLIQDYSYSLSLSEYWFCRASIAEHLQNSALKKEYLQQAYIQNSQSAYASLAYFQFYSYRDYMQGHRKAIKHLQAMPQLFSTHPLLINAYYLMGLYYKKDQISEEGHILRRKDWIAAIEAFQLAESTFDSLFEKNLIPSTHLSYFTQIRYHAQLERAQANLAIAQASTGGKRQIYLEYAEGVFKQLIQDFTTSHSLVRERLVQPSSPYPKVWAEAEFKLAQTYEAKKWWKEAEAILNESLEHYQQARIMQSQGLMHVWYEKGKIAQEQADYQTALQNFIEAEKAMDGQVGWSPNEKLDLWIQQSLCCKDLHQLDQAMLLLSKVINDDVISPLRIKAMFLRADIYILQGRPELAIKQLEATARKGGEWAQKAQEKLEYVYGY